MTSVTTIQVSKELRNRLYRVKDRATYEDFLNGVCELYEKKDGDTGK